MTPTISRRQFVGGAAAGFAGSLLAAPALIAQTAPTRLTFAFAPDESGAIQALIDGYNAAADGRVEVSWALAPEESDAFFRMMQSEFLAGSDDIDVFGSDVIWTAEFAAADRIHDLTPRINRDLDTRAILRAALNSTFHRNRYWAAPWYTDAGMLFYRRDLLEEAGIAEPPATWDALAEAARIVMDAAGTPHGFVFQGARYEGGVTNALEFIWSAGGRAWTPQSEVAGAVGMRMMDPNVIVIDSPASAAGLAKARELVETGIAPEAVAGFNERDALAVFAAGDAVFMRNWPFAYGLLGSEEFGPVTPDQVGVARIPTLTADRPSYSALGGWNLAVNRRTPSLDAAWDFIRYAVAPERQRAMAETGGFLPTLAGLYDDEDLREAVPVLGLGEAAVRSARARPISTIYSRLSPRIAIMFNRVLTGEVAPREAVQRAERELQTIMATGGG
jgi:multiple sugar transport system substrate-binding protein